MAQGEQYPLALKRNQHGLLAQAEWALQHVVPQHEAHGWASHNTPLRWVDEDQR